MHKSSQLHQHRFYFLDKIESLLCDAVSCVTSISVATLLSDGIGYWIASASTEKIISWDDILTKVILACSSTASDSIIQSGTYMFMTRFIPMLRNIVASLDENLTVVSASLVQIFWTKAFIGKFQHHSRNVCK